MGTSQVTKEEFMLEELLWLATHAEDFKNNTKNKIAKDNLEEVLKRIKEKYVEVSC